MRILERSENTLFGGSVRAKFTAIEGEDIREFLAKSFVTPLRHAATRKTIHTLSAVSYNEPMAAE